MDIRLSGNEWDWLYATRALDTVGWYEPDPIVSRELVAEALACGGRVRLYDIYTAVLVVGDKDRASN